MKTCRLCNLDKPTSAYSKTQNRKKVNVVCRACRKLSAKRGRITSWKRKHKKVLILKRERKIKLTDMFGGKCIICGYDKCGGALHFHHLNPKTKTFSISNPPKIHTFEQVLEEAAKCVLVCANCHAEIHAGLVTIPQYIEDFCSNKLPVVV